MTTLVLSTHFHPPRNAASSSTGSKVEGAHTSTEALYFPVGGKEWQKPTKEPSDQLSVSLVHLSGELPAKGAVKFPFWPNSLSVSTSKKHLGSLLE